MFHAPHIPNSNKSSAAFNGMAENSTKPSTATLGCPRVLMDGYTASPELWRCPKNLGVGTKSWKNLLEHNIRSKTTGEHPKEGHEGGKGLEGTRRSC